MTSIVVSTTTTITIMVTIIARYYYLKAIRVNRGLHRMMYHLFNAQFPFKDQTTKHTRKQHGNIITLK